MSKAHSEYKGQTFVSLMYIGAHTEIWHIRHKTTYFHLRIDNGDFHVITLDARFC